jgi:hypothetical protein
MNARASKIADRMARGLIGWCTKSTNTAAMAKPKAA